MRCCYAHDVSVFLLVYLFHSVSSGFLNVDDDEVDEDHEEDDGIQEGDETRLLENSGWSSRTRSVQNDFFFPHSIEAKHYQSCEKHDEHE